jgi:hypothetical protein
MNELEDHGLPLVALKEQRRELVVSLMGRTGPLCKSSIRELAAIQSAISAVECVIADVDQEQSGYYGMYAGRPLLAN